MMDKILFDKVSERIKGTEFTINALVYASENVVEIKGNNGAYITIPDYEFGLCSYLG
jgi:hypothetical protein